MATPRIAAKDPKSFELKEGKIYAWCACGQSKNQPFCDGSHKGTEFSPEVFKADKSKTVWFCMCKHTGNKPFCDGTHKKV